MSKQRTYWHLEQKKKVPSSYEVATSKLLYYTKNGFELDVPVKSWYETHQQKSPFNCENIDEFRDPRATTYTRYVELQKTKESFVDQIFEIIEQSNYDRNLEKDWIRFLNEILPQLRFFSHGMQMVAAYVGHMAPSGKITIAAALQAADEMRRIQKCAYRMCQLQVHYPEFGRSSAVKWQGDALWQPLRCLIERLLVTYDWGEAFVALNLVVKPVVENLFNSVLSELARKHGDYQFANILMSLREDSDWHLQWGRALLAHVVENNPDVSVVVKDWENLWYPRIDSACNSFVKVFESFDMARNVPRLKEVVICSR